MYQPILNSLCCFSAPCGQIWVVLGHILILYVSCYIWFDIFFLFFDWIINWKYTATWIKRSISEHPFYFHIYCDASVVLLMGVMGYVRPSCLPYIGLSSIIAGILYPAYHYWPNCYRTIQMQIVRSLFILVRLVK